jgi:hypothetical protein
MQIKNTLLLGLVFLLGVMIPLQVNAADEEDDKRILAQSCPGQYYSFLAEVSNKHTRGELAADFFTRSYCQLYDIVELNDKLDDMRVEMRAATISSCSDFVDLADDYKDIKAEIYFVRHVSESSPGVFQKKDLAIQAAHASEVLERLRTEMFGIFVTEEGWFSDSKFNELFDFWKLKYEKEIENYRVCDEGPWAEMSETWEDFRETMALMTNEKGKFAFDVEPYPRKSKEERKAEQHFFTRSTLDPFINFAKNRDQRELEVPPKLTVDELIQAGEITTIQGAFDALENSGSEFDVYQSSAERMARYDRLYGENGAGLTTELQGLVQDMDDLVKSSNDTDFPAIQNAVDDIYGRWCK